MADMRGLEDAVRKSAESLHRRAAERTLRDTAAAAPRRTGRLSKSLRLLRWRQDRDRFTVTIGTPLDYARFTDEGTKPHPIRARRAGVLRFWWERGPDGPGIYYYARVNHPGTKGTGWFSGRMPDRWREALRREAR